METVIKIVQFVAPMLAGFITSILIPFLVKRMTLRHLKRKIDEITPDAQYKELQKDIKEIKHEILLMRGKIDK